MNRIACPLINILVRHPRAERRDLDMSMENARQWKQQVSNLRLRLQVLCQAGHWHMRPVESRNLFPRGIRNFRGLNTGRNKMPCSALNFANLLRQTILSSIFKLLCQNYIPVFFIQINLLLCPLHLQHCYYSNYCKIKKLFSVLGN